MPALACGASGCSSFASLWRQLPCAAGRSRATALCLHISDGIKSRVPVIAVIRDRLTLIHSEAFRESEP